MRPLAAGVLGCASFLLIGWSGLVVPSLIRSIKDAFDQSDAGMGFFYFVFAIAWASGAFGGGFVVERLGRRTVLTTAAALIAVRIARPRPGAELAIFLVAAVPGRTRAPARSMAVPTGSFSTSPLGPGQGAQSPPPVLQHRGARGSGHDRPARRQRRTVAVDRRRDRSGRATGGHPLRDGLDADRPAPTGGRGRRIAGRGPAPGSCAAPGRAHPAHGGRDRLLRRVRDRGVELARPLPRASAAQHRDPRPDPVLGGNRRRSRLVSAPTGRPLRPSPVHRDLRGRIGSHAVRCRPRSVIARVGGPLRPRRRRVRPDLPDDRRARRRAVPGSIAAVSGFLGGTAVAGRSSTRRSWACSRSPSA